LNDNQYGTIDTMTTNTLHVENRPDASPASTPRSKFSISRLTRRLEAGALGGTLVVFIFFSIIGGSKFLSAGGFASWLNVAAELAIIAIPVCLVMIVGELDLSVGSVLAGSSMTLAIVSGYLHLPVWLGIVLALAVGALTGLINGLLTTRTNVPSFVVTLGTNFALVGLTLGLARLVTGSTNVSFTPGPISKAVFGTLIAGQFEVSIIWAIVVAVVVGWVLHMTPWGNWIFAIGGDKESARAAGIPVAKTKIAIFVLSGLGAALVGIIQTCLYNGASTDNGQSYVFDSIIAVVVGGVLLTGGYGSVVGVGFGALTFAIVNEGIYYTNWDSDWASLILGILLTVAVLMNNNVRRFAIAGIRARKSSTKENA
jgi:simple sugar transport system permease protein